MYLVEKKLGVIKSGNAIKTGVVASVSGDYTVEVFVSNKWTNITLTCVSGSEIEVPNTFVANTSVQFRIKFPTASQASDKVYVTTGQGQIMFQFFNHV